MKVYLVFSYCDDEGIDIKYIFSSRKKAVTACIEHNKKDPEWSFWHYEEYEVE